MAKPLLINQGDIFGRWTVLERTRSGKYSHKIKMKTWSPTAICKCDCGEVKEVYVANLIHGKSKGCGCDFSQIAKTKFTKHGLSDSKEHLAWLSMKGRCYNKSQQSFKNYGGRGIIVCDRWLSKFEFFFSDMGAAPSTKHSIDRINNNGNYEPKNCRWATPLQQSKNKRQAVNSLKNKYGKHHFETPWSEIKKIKWDFALKNMEKIKLRPFVNYSWQAHEFVVSNIKKGREEKISGENLRSIKLCGLETVEFIFNVITN